MLLLFIGAAAATTATGGFGIYKTAKAGIDAHQANKLNVSANELVETSTKELNDQRAACGNSLSRLGEEKIYVLNSTMSNFLDTFSNKMCHRS